MITQKEMEEFVDENMPILKLVVQTQWDFIKFSDVQKWLNKNFKNDITGKYCAIKILLNLIYYTKKDIISLLKFGLYEKILGERLKTQLIVDKNIYTGKTDNINEINAQLNTVLFAPISDSTKPYESGNQMISDLVHSLGIDKNQVDYHWQIEEDQLKKYKTLIFVDDCLGSGNQIKRFLNSPEVKKLREIAANYKIDIYCLVLIGYSVNIDLLKKELEKHQITLTVCELLDDRHRIFSTQNSIWGPDPATLLEILVYFKTLAKSKGIGYLGYKKLDFAVILNNRTPNWSLPLLWKNGLEWDFLIQRKTSFL